MPELPEVEVVKRSLEKKILNLIIKKVEIIDGRLRYKINKENTSKLIGKIIRQIKRKYKFLISNILANSLSFDNDATPKDFTTINQFYDPQYDKDKGGMYNSQRTTIANNGQIVVALIDKTEATLKKFKNTSSKIVLIPSNDLYQAQSYDLPRVQIQGILVGLMRKY